MRLSCIDWIFGMMVFSLLGLLMISAGASEWYGCVSLIGAFGCLAGCVYTSMKEE